MNAIEIKGFTKKYNDFVAVNNIDLSIPKGTIVGFVGKNGAGKSTTIRSLLNMIHPTAGTICILGLDSQKDAKEIKSKVSYVPSEALFYDGLKVEQVLEFARSFSTSSKEELHKLVEYFELDQTKITNELSLGNKKKVSLIQGFLKNSELIILDEPTNGLDPLMQNKFYELLLEEKKKGKTIFLSSHNLSEVEKYCDQVAIIKDGQIMEILDMESMKEKHKQIVSYKTKDGKEDTSIIQGDINETIKMLSTLDLAYVEIKNTTIEDEFIDYFKGEE